MKTRNRGFTLIELLAAMAILAVVSVMAVQALSGAIVQRGVLMRVDDDAAELARALALLRHDLEAAAPIPRLDDGGALLPSIVATPQDLTLVRGGLATLRAGGTGGFTGGYGVVTWALSADGSLSRRVFASLQASAAADAEAVILSGVSALGLTPLRGDLPSVATPDVLPAGFALTLQHARHGTLTVVVAR